MRNKEYVPSTGMKGKNQMTDKTNTLDLHYRTLAWGASFILLGVLILIPGNQFRIFLFGIGIILLALNLARHLNQTRVNTFTLALGLIAITLAGSATLLSWLGIHFELPLFPVLLVGAGVMMLASVIFRKRENGAA
jgi:hypothetical protein